MGVFDNAKFFDEPGAPAEPGLADDFTQGIRSGYQSAKGQLHKLAGTTMNAVGLDGSEQNAKAKVANAYAQVDGQGLVPFEEADFGYKGLRWLSGALGQSVPISAAVGTAGLATAGAGLGPAIAAGTLAGAPFKAGEILQRSEADPANRLQSPGAHLANAALPAVAAAGLEAAVPAYTGLRVLGKTGQSTLGQIGARTALSFPAEAVSEGGGELALQAGLNQMNPNTGYDWEAVKQNAIQGAIVGGALGTVGGVGELGHKVAGAASGAPGRLMDSAKALVPDSVKQRLGGAKEAAGEAVDTATEFTKDKFDEGLDAAARAAEWAKGSIKARTDDLKAWGKEFLDDPAEPDSFKAQVQDAIRNPGDKAKQIWMATEKFAREAATKAQAISEAQDLPGKLRAIHKAARDGTNRLMDRLAKGGESVDDAELAAAGEDPAKLMAAFEKADKTALDKTLQWGDELLKSNLGEEKTAQVKAWMSDAASKVSQQGIAAMRRAQSMAQTAAQKAKAFNKAANAKAAKMRADAKKSEALPEGLREKIGAAIVDVLGEDHPLLDGSYVRGRDGQTFTPLQDLADGLRAVLTHAANGEAPSSDVLAQLYDVAGPKTRELVDAAYIAVGEPTADTTSFFKALNEAIDAGKSRDGVITTMRGSLRPELRDAVRDTELQQEADVLRAWLRSTDSDAKAGVQKTTSAAEVTHRDAMLRSALEHRYGPKTEAVLAAIRKNVLDEDLRSEEERAPPMDSDEDTRTVGANAGTREFAATDGNSRVYMFPQNGNLYLNPADAPPSKFEDAATQRIKTARKNYPDANVEFRSIDDLDETDPRVEKMVREKYEDLVTIISSDPKWADLGDPEELAWKELKKYGLVVAEQNKLETGITKWELAGLRLDTDPKYKDSASRIDTRGRDAKDGVALDAVKITEFMNKKMKEAKEYSPIDDLGPGFRDARMFMEGIAAVQDHLGYSFKIPDSTKITRQGMTWAQARKLDPRTAKDKAYDADSPRIQASGEEFARASTRRPAGKGEQMSFGEKGMNRDSAALAEDVAREKTRDARAAREWTLLTEQIMDENRRQGNDETGYEGDIERGIHTEKRAARAELRDLEATIAEVGKQLDAEMMFGRDGKEEVALRQQLGWLNTAKDALQARIDKMVPENRPSGRRKIDPFGPTHDALRGEGEFEVRDAGAGKGKPRSFAQTVKDVQLVDKGPTRENAAILTNADGSTRGDTVMGRRKPAQHAEGATTGKPVPANAREARAMAAERAAEGPPDPKAVAAKKAAFVERARSGEETLLKDIEASTDAKGLQRAAMALQGDKKAAATLDAINARLSVLVQDEDVAYGLQTKKYSLARGADLGNRGPYTAKDQRKADRANKFIGRGSARSSTAAYAAAFGDRANTGAYEPTDVVFISAEGARGGRLSPDFKEIEKAVRAGATLITDTAMARARPYNVGERQVSAYLEANGYIETAAGQWQPETKKYSLMTTLTSEVDEIEVHGKVWDLGEGVRAVEATHAATMFGKREAIQKGKVFVNGTDANGDYFSGWVDSLTDAREYAASLGVKTHGPIRAETNDSAVMSMQRVSPGRQGPVNRRAVEQYIEKVLGPKVQVAWSRILHAGEFERTATADIIRLSVHNLNPMSVAFHESLHGFFQQLRDAKQGEIAQVVQRAAGSAPVMNQLKKLLKNEPGALKQLSDPEERAAYMYQFWAQGKLTIGDKAQGIFQRIAQFLREITGLWTNDERAVKILEYFHSGEYQQNRSDPNAVYRALMESGTSRVLNKAKAMVEPFREMGEALVSAGGTRLRDSGIPALRELADAMKLKTTSEGDDPGFMPAARAEHMRLMNQLGADLKPYSEGAINEALEALQTGMRARSAPARIVQRIVQKRLDDTLDYMQTATVNIEHIAPKRSGGAPYFPRSWDASYISSHQAEFLKMAEKYELAGEWKDPHSTMLKLMVTDGAEFTVEVDKPGMQHAKQRTLHFVSHADAAPFMRKDMYQIMNNYFTQATRRAEWARRFGDDGAKVNELLDRAAAEGATKEQLDTARKFVRAVDGTLGDTLNPTARRAMGNMIVYQNIRLLPLAIFSSIVDPLGVLVRGGTLHDSFNAFKRGMKEIVKNYQDNPKSDKMTQLAEAIGTIENAALVHTMGASFNQGMLGDKGRAINDAFFRYNMMDQYNRSMRTSATEAALGFLARHGTKPGEHSERYLRELGLEASDIELDADGRPKLFTHQGLSEAHSVRMLAAVNRWVDGAVLRPDAVDKAIWMSDPHFALVSHLKSFVLSFHETILKRVAHEMKHGNYTPAMALAGYVPVMLAADTLKGLIQGGGEEPPWKQSWGITDYLWSAMERAGLFGTGQFALDAATDIKRGGSGFSALTGPTIEQLTDGVRVLEGAAQFKPFALKSMPANALYAGLVGGEASDPKFVD